jgi:hypothetical protein
MVARRGKGRDFEPGVRRRIVGFDAGCGFAVGVKAAGDVDEAVELGDGDLRAG